MHEPAAHADAMIAQHGEGARQRFRRKAEFAGEQALLVGQTETCRPAIHRATSSDFARASSCSLSVLETPLGLSGSMSIGSQQRRRISASLVVLSFLPSRILIRFARRESRAGFTSFRGT